MVRFSLRYSLWFTGRFLTLDMENRHRTVVASGASLSAYAFSNAQTANAGNYSVVVANTLTNVISAPAQLSVTLPVFQLGSGNAHQRDTGNHPGGLR